MKVHDSGPEIPLDMHVFFSAPVAIDPFVFNDSHSACFLTGFAEKTEIFQKVSLLISILQPLGSELDAAFAKMVNLYTIFIPSLVPNFDHLCQGEYFGAFWKFFCFLLAVA